MHSPLNVQQLCALCWKYLHIFFYVCKFNSDSLLVFVTFLSCDLCICLRHFNMMAYIVCQGRGQSPHLPTSMDTAVFVCMYAHSIEQGQEMSGFCKNDICRQWENCQARVVAARPTSATGPFKCENCKIHVVYQFGTVVLQEHPNLDMVNRM
jgi:hypothetical protein